MNDAEWREFRRQGLGASDVAAVVGLSPWVSPWALYAEKVGLTEGQDETEAMRLGKLMEPVLRQMFETKTGLYVRCEQARLHHPAEPWMRATIDGGAFETTGDPDRDFAIFTDASVLADAIAGYEAKWTSEPPWDEIPAHYQCQAQWQMAVTGMQVVMFGVLHMPFGRPDYRVYELARDDNDIALLIDRCRTFWWDHVVAGVPPDADAHPATVEAVNHAWEPDPTETVEAGELGRALHGALLERKAQAKALDTEITALEVALKVSMRTATALVDGEDDKGKPRVLVTWKGRPDTRVDIDALRAAEPDLVKKYTVTNTVRVLLPKAVKGAAPDEQEPS